MHKRTWAWLELNCKGLVWFYILASWPLLFFYNTHDMSRPCIQYSMVWYPNIFLTVQWSISGNVHIPLQQESKKRKATEKSFASPFKNTAEQKKGNCKTSYANMQKQKSYSKTFFSSALIWSKLSTYTLIKRRNSFCHWIYLNKTSNQIST